MTNLKPLSLLEADRSHHQSGSPARRFILEPSPEKAVKYTGLLS